MSGERAMTADSTCLELSPLSRMMTWDLASEIVKFLERLNYLVRSKTIPCPKYSLVKFPLIHE